MNICIILLIIDLFKLRVVKKMGNNIDSFDCMLVCTGVRVDVFFSAPDVAEFSVHPSCSPDFSKDVDVCAS